MNEDPTSTPIPGSERPADSMDRRTVLAVAGAVGAAGVLAACSSSGNPAPSESVPSKKADGGVTIAQTSDIPVGGGKILDDQQVVVTQPSKGEFSAFTTICPHQGCPVNEVTADTIVCPCHGSEFSATTGEVLVGPAMTGLDPVAIKIEGNEIIAQV
jgi:Rieske Fe-S protein